MTGRKENTTVGLQHIRGVQVRVEDGGLEGGEEPVLLGKAVRLDTRRALILQCQAWLRKGPLRWGGLRPGMVQITLLENSDGLIRPRIWVDKVISAHRCLH